MKDIAVRLLNPYASLVAGLALAAGIALTQGGWSPAERVSTARAAITATPAKYFPSINTPYRVYYLASSPQEAELAASLEAEAGWDRAGLKTPDP